MNSALFFEKCSKTSDLFIDTYIVETCFQQNGDLHRRNMLSTKWWLTSRTQGDSHITFIRTNLYSYHTSTFYTLHQLPNCWMVQEQLFTITKTCSCLESQLLIIKYLFTLIRQLLIKVTQNIRLESNCNYDQFIYSFNQLLTCSLRHKRQTRNWSIHTKQIIQSKPKSCVRFDNKVLQIHIFWIILSYYTLTC